MPFLVFPLSFLLGFHSHVSVFLSPCFHVCIPETDHQGAVQRHCNHLMEFQGKMHEACLKFESLEEEHLAQMVTFMIKTSQVCPLSLCEFHVYMLPFQIIPFHD